MMPRDALIAQLEQEKRTAAKILEFQGMILADIADCLAHGRPSMDHAVRQVASVLKDTRELVLCPHALAALESSPQEAPGEFDTPIASAVYAAASPLNGMELPDADTLLSLAFTVASTINDFERRAGSVPLAIGNGASFRQPCVPDEKYPQACKLAPTTHRTSDGVERCDLCGCPCPSPALGASSPSEEQEPK